MSFSTFHHELKALLDAHEDRPALVPGGIFTRIVNVASQADYPTIYTYPDPAKPDKLSYQANIVLIPQNRYPRAQARGTRSFDYYTRIEVRAPRNSAGWTASAAIWSWLDTYQDEFLNVAGYHLPIDFTGGTLHSPVDDETEASAIFSWQDVMVTASLY